MKASAVLLALAGSTVALASAHSARSPTAHSLSHGGMVKRVVASKRQLGTGLLDGLLGGAGGASDSSINEADAATSAPAAGDSSAAAAGADETSAAAAAQTTSAAAAQTTSAAAQTTSAAPRDSSSSTSPAAQSSATSAAPADSSSASSSDAATRSAAESSSATRRSSAASGSSAVTRALTETSTSGASSTGSSSAPSSSASAASDKKDDGSDSGGGGISKKVLIPIIVVASCVAAAGIIWTIVRKTKFSPSRKFEDRLEPIDYTPEWNHGARHDDGDADAFLAHARNGSGMSGSAGATARGAGATARGAYAPSLARSDSGKTSMHGGYGGAVMSESMHPMPSIPYAGPGYVQQSYFGAPAHGVPQPGYPGEQAYAYPDLHRAGSFSHGAMPLPNSPSLDRMPSTARIASPAPIYDYGAQARAQQSMRY
ncbi:hypothetical protein Rhopal_002760-T1 [Rhodotorula paludigena]|uniref:Uncharacterized protein n=1 Tax=Rhodotorula paludigena TaxID=86838 RepID=A0AAV5GJU3_9BASI|nr:hypothetical protein Rhopal_002760-T1 [Rhodotorula paludigena]